jgi:uncharacterized protein YxjI
MHLLDRQLLFVREHVGLFKLSGAYDLLDPETQQPVGLARENLSGFLKFLRLLVNRSALPTRVEISAGEGQPPVLVLKRGFTLFRARVDVLDGAGVKIGWLKSKMFSIGGGFWVMSADDQPFAEVRGDWKGWNFKLLDLQGREMGQVTKKWGGLGRELFTTADNYVIEVRERSASNALLLSAALAIDLVFKEKNN